MSQRIASLSYGGHSLATPRSNPLLVQKYRLEAAKAALALAASIYVEEWESMSPLVRPAKPNTSARRAFEDGFISGPHYFALATEEEA